MSEVKTTIDGTPTEIKDVIHKVEFDFGGLKVTQVIVRKENSKVEIHWTRSPMEHVVVDNRKNFMFHQEVSFVTEFSNYHGIVMRPMPLFTKGD